VPISQRNGQERFFAARRMTVGIGWQVNGRLIGDALRSQEKEHQSQIPHFVLHDTGLARSIP
jgi:hypothetical protein